jgi:hypothetical protein
MALLFPRPGALGIAEWIEFDFDTARDQFLHQKSGYDRFASARIAGEQKAYGLARQHCVIDSSDLMRQRLNDRSVNRQYRIKQMSEANTQRF